MLTLLLTLAGCVIYSTPADSGFEDGFHQGRAPGGTSAGCELRVESDGDIKREGSVAALDFYATVEGQDCDYGATHDIEMEEWDDGEGLSNPSESGQDTVRTGEPRRYTLTCIVIDEAVSGECGCTLRLEGTDQEHSLSMVLD